MDDFQQNEVGDYFCRFTFGQFITLAILELATLFFVFYLGARYGPEMIRDRTSSLSQKETQLPLEGPKTVGDIVDEKVAVKYSFPEVLTDNLPSTPSPQEEAAPVQEEVLPEDSFKSKPIVRVKSSDIAKYTIQVGSYPSAAEASKAISYWQKKGYDSFMSIGEIPDRGTWYRVRIGGFGNQEDAQEFLEKFKSSENIPALVVLSTS